MPLKNAARVHDIKLRPFLWALSWVCSTTTFSNKIAESDSLGTANNDTVSPPNTSAYLYAHGHADHQVTEPIKHHISHGGSKQPTHTRAELPAHKGANNNAF
jgi:hypothetical protein